MKTIYGEDRFLRLKNDIAEVKVKSGKYRYIPKSEWKEKVRDAEKAPSTLVKKKEQKEASSTPRKIKRKQPKQ